MPRKNASYTQSVRIFYKLIGEIADEPEREFAPYLSDEILVEGEV